MITISIFLLIVIYVGIFLRIQKDISKEESEGISLILLGNAFVVILMSSGLYWGLISLKGRDTEYWGSYVVYVQHEEPWNEYIQQTCTETDSKGKTRTYDCSYVRYHSEQWFLCDNLGDTTSITESYYESLVATWKLEEIIGRNDGYTQSGNIFRCNYNNKRNDLEPLVKAHTYYNIVDASDSLFKFRSISDKQAKEMGLFAYPYDWGSIYYPSVLGYKTSKDLDYVNAIYGSQHEVKVWVLVFHDVGKEIAYDQKQYWRGGNKNELVTCVGLKNGSVAWCDVFSWSESDDFLIECREAVMSDYGKDLDIDKYARFLEKNIPSKWTRKHFKDFEYLKVNLSFGSIMIIIFINMVVGLVLPGCIVYQTYFDQSYAWKRQRRNNLF